MLENSRALVPVLTSDAGACLTAENWQEVGVGIASFYLDSLLLKPGLELLSQIDDLKHYLGWAGHLVLNAMNLKMNKDGGFTIVSPYDGSKITCTCPELMELIKHLKPDLVLLPKQIIENDATFWADWPDETLPLIHADELQQLAMNRPYGVYFHLDNELTMNQINQLATCSKLPRYLSGKMNLDLIKRLADIGVEYIETDLPAQRAVQGIVFNKAGELDLGDNNTEFQFETIDPNCACPTCSQQLTKAYLHHLLMHTPLLCQRFLIQHNVSWVN